MAHVARESPAEPAASRWFETHAVDDPRYRCRWAPNHDEHLLGHVQSGCGRKLASDRQGHKLTAIGPATERCYGKARHESSWTNYINV